MPAELYRIGDKLVSREKILTALDAILQERAGGATQREASHVAGVPRTFVSNLETLGELRRGSRVAIIAFPVDNGDDLRELADRFGVEFTLAFSQQEREHAGFDDPAQLFNRTLDTIAALQDFDVVLVLASDWRIETIRRIVEAELIGICLGTSPLTADAHVDLSEVEAILCGLRSGGNSNDSSDEAPRGMRRIRKQGRRALSGAAQLVKEWDRSKK
ncbi:MAG: transcriptional regulator [Actinomycetia bacterium]|nr:transcriptional regulator [Actinomycetes bacterium]